MFGSNLTSLIRVASGDPTILLLCGTSARARGAYCPRIFMDSAGVSNATPHADTIVLDPTAPVVHISLPSVTQLVSGTVQITAMHTTGRGSWGYLVSAAGSDLPQCRFYQLEASKSRFYEPYRGISRLSANSGSGSSSWVLAHRIVAGRRLLPQVDGCRLSRSCIKLLNLGDCSNNALAVVALADLEAAGQAWDRARSTSVPPRAVCCTFG